MYLLAFMLIWMSKPSNCKALAMLERATLKTQTRLIWPEHLCNITSVVLLWFNHQVAKQCAQLMPGKFNLAVRCCYLEWSQNIKLEIYHVCVSSHVLVIFLHLSTLMRCSGNHPWPNHTFRVDILLTSEKDAPALCLL